MEPRVIDRLVAYLAVTMIFLVGFRMMLTLSSIEDDLYAIRSAQQRCR